MKTGAGGRCYHIPMLLGAGEVKLVYRALRWKEKGNIHITYDCILIYGRMRGMTISGKVLGEIRRRLARKISTV
jgi:hypothetical protein